MYNIKQDYYLDQELKMSDLTVLRESNPALAEVLDSWKSNYARNFDFSSDKEKSIFFEALVDIAKHIAKNNNSANLSVEFNSQGVSKIICTS